jgi:hypothetical protein
MKRQIVSMLFSLAVLLGCTFIWEDKKLTNEYYICSIEHRICICYLEDFKYNIRMIGPSVSAVGMNQEHIIIKQHPVRDGSTDYSKTLYYIIPLKNRVSTEGEKNYYGPYQKHEFEEARRKLSVSEKLEFNRL